MTVAAKLLVGGGDHKNPKSCQFYLILRATAPGTVVVIAIDCFTTLPAPEGSRWRSFTPVEWVWVAPGPIGPPRSLIGWRMVTAKRGPAMVLTTCSGRNPVSAPRTSRTSEIGPRFFLSTAFPLLCPGIHLALRLGFTGLRIRAFKLYNSLLSKVVAGSFK